jgi:hypothetical protein
MGGCPGGRRGRVISRRVTQCATDTGELAASCPGLPSPSRPLPVRVSRNPPRRPTCRPSPGRCRFPASPAYHPGCRSGDAAGHRLVRVRDRRGRLRVRDRRRISHVVRVWCRDAWATRGGRPRRDRGALGRFIEHRLPGYASCPQHPDQATRLRHRRTHRSETTLGPQACPHPDTP